MLLSKIFSTFEKESEDACNKSLKMHDKTTILVIWFFCLLMFGLYLNYSPEMLSNVTFIGVLAILGGYLIYKTIVVFGDFSEAPLMRFRLSYWLMWFFYALAAYLVFVYAPDKI